jgi:hypothetical protein
VAEGRYDAAVAAPIAAEHYRLQVLASDVQDNQDAVTRFLLVSRPGPPPRPTGADRTTLFVFIEDDHAGRPARAAHRVRGARDQPHPHRVPPERGGLGQYFFSIDCDGHLAEARVGEALAALHRSCASVRVLGSYPRPTACRRRAGADGRRRLPGRGGLAVPAARRRRLSGPRGSLAQVIDLKQLRDDPERVRASQRARGDDPAGVDALLAADEARRAAVTRADGLRAEQKAASQAVKSASKEDRPALLERAKALAAGGQGGRVGAGRRRCRPPDRPPRGPERRAARRPRGRRGRLRGARAGRGVPTYDFPVKDHLDLGTALGAIDTERGAKVSGSRFAFLTGWGALLELALVNLAIGQAVANDFNPVIAPALVRPEAMEGTGFLGAHAAEVYKLADDDLYLVGTSEVPLAAFHSGRSSRSCRCATPASRPASAARPAATARTPAASSGCTSSTRSRCSRTCPSTRPRRSTRGCSRWRRCSSACSSCRSG